MENFKDIFRQRMNEATWKNLRKAGINVVPNKRIMDAIENRKQVDLDYVDGDGIKHHRNVEIYAYGISRAHNQIIRAFQTWGSSETMGQNEKGWRTFRVDRITRMRVLNTFSSFDEGPDKRYPGSPRYKRNDKDMIYIFKQVDLNGPRRPKKDNTVPVEPGQQHQEEPKQIYQQEPQPQQQVATPQQPEQQLQADKETMANIAAQGAAKTQPNGPVNPDTGEGFKKEFNDKVNIIKDKLEQDAETANNDTIGDDNTEVENK